MTDTSRLLAAYDEQLRVAEMTNVPPGAHAEQDGPVVRIVGQRRRGFVSGRRGLGLDGDALDALIARQRDFFATRGEAVEWKTRGHDLPADLPQRLTAAGFTPEQPETVLVGEAAELATIDPGPSDGVTARQATTDADMHRIAEMASEVWGDDRSWLAADLIDRLRNDAGQLTVVVAEADGRVVSSARLEIEPGTQFAGLWGGSTLAEWRGRGIYRALVAFRAKVAVAQGIRYLYVDATEDSRPILQRLGFTAITTTTPYVWTPSP
ncbi:N-acetylglutamate synthase-like GNAT family acetyltransferase [Saccharothrix tamanrassetensis]|uniref:N-acetylglutamate synthase-like GNAT family acetyltransferase n=1 Tax=Saccharothrix tamanrassetensis TaxID=1051531 RepID=A0A841CPN4_9PSEU|nr:GNAT family N-acetyltransferase [Saccharothrix tamanrassetensis]MBB5958037.1 N-acetylglutamate synthase-like GNAT family acetyltransferase [Saccharothrix tamanrassetensis]